MSYISNTLNSIISVLSNKGIGGLFSHFWAKSRDKSNDEKKMQREMFGLLNSISFSLLTQYSQLYNLKKNLQNRLIVLNDKIKMQQRDDRIQAVQDFALDSSVIIKFEYISDLLGLVTTCFPNYQINPNIFQACYTSNKKYTEMNNDLNKYNNMKQKISEDENLLESLSDFLKKNIPSYLEMLRIYMPFIKTTQESLTELFVLLDKKPLQIDRPIELWGVPNEIKAK